MAVSLADERPGAKLVEEPRTMSMTLETFARNIEALTQAARVRNQQDDAVGLEGMMDTIWAMAMILREDPSLSTELSCYPEPPSPGRTASGSNGGVGPRGTDRIRELRREADALAAAFSRDASVLRRLVGEHPTADRDLPAI
jgi:hypothetical protein